MLLSRGRRRAPLPMPMHCHAACSSPRGKIIPVKWFLSVRNRSSRIDPMSGAGEKTLEEERAQRARLSYIRQCLLAPAGAIVGYAELLGEEAADGALEDMAADLDRVLEASHNLYSMVDRLLAGDAAQELFHGADWQAAQQKMRHDLRTPINGIKGYGEMLLEDLEDFGGEHLRVDFEKLLSEVTNMLARLNLIVDFSKGGGDANETGDAVKVDESMVAGLLKSIKPVAPSKLLPEETGHILVVDDLEPNRDLLSRRLKKDGHRVAMAAGGAEALAMLRAGSFDLVLLDLMMPGMNGFDVLAEMKRDEELMLVPVIMVSALDETDSVIRCIEAGADDYLPKPINPILLRARIKSGLEKKAWQDREREQKRFIRQAFSRYISPDVVDQLLANPEKLSLGGERLEITCVFTDLAGFTTLMESAEPSVVLPVLNQYLDGMCTIVRDKGGTIDKIVGDALHVFFGAPVEIPDHAERAVDCAMAMDEYARMFEQTEDARRVKFGGTRIGVHTGLVVVGNFGGDTFFDYTAHGDTVNTAARMESVNSHLGTRLCVSGDTAKACKTIQFRPVGALVLKGKSQPVEAFEPVSGISAEDLDAYLKVFALIKAEDPNASEALGRLSSDDPLVNFHLQRLASGQSGATIVFAEK